MHRHFSAALSAATVVAALGLSACSHHESESPPASPTTVTPATLSPAASPQAAPLPPPEALTDVLYRLADPAVPGAQKLSLVEAATPDDAVALDRFATALRDGGFDPMIFTAGDLAWSDRDAGDVMATVNVTTPRPGAGKFTFPMEFKPYQGGWQLSEQTAAMLLAIGNAHTDTSTAPSPTP